jgi:Trypsin-co-occurring domain 2
MGKSADTNDVELLAFLKQLRREVEESQAAMTQSGVQPMFDLEGVELEAKVLARRDSKADGGLRLYCVTIGGSQARAAEQVHTLKPKLKPRGQVGAAGR